MVAHGYHSKFKRKVVQIPFKIIFIRFFLLNHSHKFFTLILFKYFEFYFA